MRPNQSCTAFLSLVFILFGNAISQAQQIVITPDHSNGVYQLGETIRWQLAWSGGTNVSGAGYRFLKNGLTKVGEGELSFTNQVTELTSVSDVPGTMLVKVRAVGENGREVRAVGGVVAAPELIALSAPRPADFDTFWKAKLAELATVPMNPKLESHDSGLTNVDYAKVTLDNIKGTQVHGQISRPVHGEKFPGLLIVQWAGVYALQKSWVTDRAAEGWLTLNIQAHDLPIDELQSFYKQQSSGALKNYPAIGNDQRDTSYFLRMYLSCQRAVEYLAQRPDWDGKTLVVMGGSQGGMQALVTAALNPKISAALALVPAGCDMRGPDVGREPGWPKWYSNIGVGQDARAVREASRYFDVANFASQIRCPVLVGLGLIDETCPPAGIFAAINQITAPKEVVILPNAAHEDKNHSHGNYLRRCNEVWLPALRQGRAAPVAHPISDSP